MLVVGGGEREKGQSGDSNVHRGEGCPKVNPHEKVEIPSVQEGRAPARPYNGKPLGSWGRWRKGSERVQLCLTLGGETMKSTHDTFQKFQSMGKEGSPGRQEISRVSPHVEAQKGGGLGRGYQLISKEKG